MNVVNGTKSAFDDVDSLVSLSDSTMCSMSIDDLQDIDNEAGAIVQEHESASKHELDYKRDKQEKKNDDQTMKMNDGKGTKYIKTPDQVSSSKDGEASKTNMFGNINESTSRETNNEALDLQRTKDSFEGNAECDEENSESEEVQDGSTEELPFLRSVKYLEKHEIFRLFQNLAAEIVYQRPENPLQFIVEKLEKEKKANDGGSVIDKNVDQTS